MDTIVYTSILQIWRFNDLQWTLHINAFPYALE